MSPKQFLASFLTILFSSVCLAQLPTGWKAHDKSRPLPNVVTPGDSNQPGAPPSDAIVLFDGTDVSHWQAASGGEPKWVVVDGAMESVPKSGYVRTREEFGDVQLHVEFATPKNVKGNGQGRGNSGVFLMGAFEIQVLDSFENPTYADGSAGSIYGQYPPLVNASRGPGQWQTYDIVFRRPRFDENGNLVLAARATVFHNGVLIQDASEMFGPTNWIQHKGYEAVQGKVTGPISLQDHGNPVRYRNIWVRNLEERKVPEKPYQTATMEISKEDAEKLVGKYGANTVSFRNGKLYLKQAGSQLEMVAFSKTEFGFTKSAGSVKFMTDDQGNAESLELSLDAMGGTKKGKRSQPKK